VLKDDIADLQRRGAAVRQIILSKRFPSDLEDAIASAYGSLESIYGVDVDVAVRSSATAEDLPDASFAGQQETFLNIRGKDALIDAARNCMASLFTNRAISYRVSKNFDHFSVGLSIGVQVMVRSDLACSGVMFSLDTESGFADVIVINGSYGLGENIVQGAVNPDDWIVFKPLLNTHPFQPILKKRLGAKEQTLIYAEAATGKSTKNIPTPLAKQRQYCLTDDEVLLLSRWACIIEDHYTLKKGSACPMDMEWAKDGKTGQLFIVQARPETVHSQKLNRRTIETYVLKGDDPSKLTHLCSGSSVGTKIGSGRASVMHSVADEMDSFIAGSVLVTEMTDPDWEPILKRASAVVTNRGGKDWPACFNEVS
jgi:pyruvate,water dikinase